MAGRRANSRSQAEWHALARDAILDLLEDRFVVPWFEVESRIAYQRYKSFPTIDPIQLHGARRALRDEGLIIEESTQHSFPVVTIRLPFPDGRLRELERLRGTRRKLFRSYLSWAGDQQLCGSHAERVVLHSLQTAASRAGLFVPQQLLGNIHQIGDTSFNGTFDAFAYVLNVETIQQEAVLAVEVKNINSWIVPSSQELWQLLLNAAEVSDQLSILPLLVCVRYHYPVLRMAQDLGFFVTAFENQLFEPSINEEEFEEVVDDMALAIRRHSGPSEPVVTFLQRTLRRSPLSPPPEEIEWFRRQVERFRTTAALIREYEVLSRDVDPDTRHRSFESFRARLPSQVGYPLVRGW